MGNDAACKTVRISSIRMKIFDGKLGTLKNAIHVPNLRKNLLSLGALEVWDTSSLVQMEF